MGDYDSLRPYYCFLLATVTQNVSICLMYSMYLQMLSQNILYKSSTVIVVIVNKMLHLNSHVDCEPLNVNVLFI